MSYLVVGIEYRQNKKTGKPYKMLHLSQPFSDPKYGIGSKTLIEYVSASVDCPADLSVGVTVELSYGKGFDDKAYVNGVHVVEGDVPTIQVKK